VYLKNEPLNIHPFLFCFTIIFINCLKNIHSFLLDNFHATQDELKTVFDKVKDFFGDAKESFGKLTALNSTTTEELEEKPKETAK
jgi:hypothetical protein